MAGMGTFLLTPNEAEASVPSALSCGCLLTCCSFTSLRAIVRPVTGRWKRPTKKARAKPSACQALVRLFGIEMLMVTGGNTKSVWIFAQSELLLSNGPAVMHLLQAKSFQKDGCVFGAATHQLEEGCGNVSTSFFYFLK